MWAFFITSGNLWEVNYSSVKVFTKEKEQAHKQLEWSNRCATSFILTYLEIIDSNLPIPYDTIAFGQHALNLTE